MVNSKHCPSLHHRCPTYPLAHTTRTKPRRWPLILRIHKGAVHGRILLPVLMHASFTALIIFLDRHVTGSLSLPSNIVPSLSIVVGLMLVFRNQTSYDRFWTGRNCLQTCVTNVRNLARAFLVCGRHYNGTDDQKDTHLGATEEENADTESVIRVLIAILFAIKHNLRAEWSLPADSPLTLHFPYSNCDPSSSRSSSSAPTVVQDSIYSALLPAEFPGFEDHGVSLPVQLSYLVEAYIKRGYNRGWWHAPGASQLTLQLNALMDAYGKMETIRTTPIPVAHLIHAKQVLALYVSLLPFATVDDFGWWAIPVVSMVAFTLYGIEGIGSQLEDPFGYDKNDIKMDAIVEDARIEVMALLDEWKRGWTGLESGRKGRDGEFGLFGVAW